VDFSRAVVQLALPTEVSLQATVCCGVERHHLADIVDGIQRVRRWGDVERGAVLVAG
jgi:hypothetical protein